jgi:hypothetical protein
MLLVLFVAALFQPRFFQAVLGTLIRVEAWRQGSEVEFDRVGGSFFEPVTISNSRWNFHGDAGSTTRVEIAKLEADLSWRNLFKRSTARWFQRLSLTGVKGKLFLPFAEPEAKLHRRAWLNWRPSGGHWAPVPAALEGNDIDFFFQGGNDFVRVEECRFTASDVDRGEFHAGRVSIRQPWLARTFKNVHGTTAMQDEKFVLANVVLDPGVEIRSLSAELPQLARGRLNLDMQLAAFDGTLQAEAATVPHDHGLAFEAGGNFTQVNIAKFASFFALSDAAGGTIKKGNFSFRGSPQNPAKATGKLSFDASNFQWETRQWDSLTLGLVLMDGRLQMPHFDLHQGKNTLTVSGELTLPDAAERWWHGAFNCAVKARIGNLTELSALLLPEFKYAAGEVSVDGNIRGHGEEFFGQLVVEGRSLTWRNAPIQALHATVKLDGKELKVAHMELVNGDDYLRGNGVVNLFGPTQYWGELRVAVENLASYAAFLQKPVLPEPLAGGAIIDWTGEGSATGHSGKFMARLRMVRTLGALAQQLHPINADLEASYGPGTMNFTKFVLSDDDSSFTANIAIGDKALNLSGIRLRHKDQLQLEGDALLPLDVWQKWPDVSLGQLLTDDIVSRFNLVAHALDLEKAAQLSGWKFPVAGTLDGTLSGEGAINSLKLAGALKLERGRIPLGSTGDVIEEANGEFSFGDDTFQIVKFTGRHPFGSLETTGSVRLANPRDPELQLKIQSPKATMTAFGGTVPKIAVDSLLDLELIGPLSAARLSGSAKLLSLEVDTVPDFTSLWRAERRVDLPPLFSFSGEPWAHWTYDVEVQPADPAGLKGGDSEIQVDLRIRGTGAQPTLSGKIELGGLDIGAQAPSTGEHAPVPGHSDHLEMALAPPTAHLLVTFFESRPEEPSLDLELSGTAGQVPGKRGGTPFRASMTGPLNHLMRVYFGAPPLTNEVVQATLSHTLGTSSQTISLNSDAPIKLALRTDAAIAAGVEQFEWMPPGEEAPDGVSAADNIHKDAPH